MNIFCFPMVILILVQKRSATPQNSSYKLFCVGFGPYDSHTSRWQRAVCMVGCCANQGTLLTRTSWLYGRWSLLWLTGTSWLLGRGSFLWLIGTSWVLWRWSLLWLTGTSWLLWTGWHKFYFGLGPRKLFDTGLTCRIFLFCDKDAHSLFLEQYAVILD